ncbi:uncharacterized protein [Epargyreus clarus]|uniref:uncharacterized protein n=1 Tax=Epargyreus clarus TaxID=520877 RepID=UPI003C2FB2A2
MDPINMRPLPGPYPRGEDPCNPLYWYPRNIPEYCNYRNFPIPPKPIGPPLPMPLPVPVPQPSLMMPMPAPAPLPLLPPLPYGVPIAPTNPMIPGVRPYQYEASLNPMVPSSYPYSSGPQQAGMVPGLPGLVTRDGGINILPFSDAYSDLIETHKNQMIRRRLQKLIREYEDFPNSRSYKRLRKYARRNM